MRRAAGLQELLGPAVLVLVVALVGAIVSTSNASYFTNALVNVAIVTALYLFIGNSGVLSFGHISFVAVGAWTAGVLSVPASEKPAIMPNLAHALRDRTTGTTTFERVCHAVWPQRRDEKPVAVVSRKVRRP